MKSILILGASGFVGRNLFEKLRSKYDVLAPSRSALNLLDESSLEKYFKTKRIEVVINAAVVGGSRKEEHENFMLQNNLKMFFNIVRNKKYFKKMIHFGSGAEYDKKRALINVKEEDFDKKIPEDEYGLYKYICSKYIEETNAIVNLRIFGLFGKYEDYRYRFISNAICRNIYGLPITLHQDVYFDYLYINDFIKIIDYFIINDAKYKSYNIGTGSPVSLLTLAKKINEIADIKSEILVKKKGLNWQYSCNNNRLKEETKDFSFQSISGSLEELYGWYKRNKNSIDKNLI